MNKNILLCVLNAKYVHMSPAPWCLMAGVKAYAPEYLQNTQVFQATINQPLEEIAQEIIQKSPSVVTFSCYIWNITHVLTLANTLKKALPNVCILLGGPEVSFRAEEVLAHKDIIDFVLRGEGEESFPAFLHAYFNESQNLCDVSGIAYYNNVGTYVENPLAFNKKLPPSPLSVGYHLDLKGRISYIETSRGCPYHCAFCLSGLAGKPNYFPMKSVKDDMLALANADTRTIKFVDRTFNANAHHANEILSFILENYGTNIPKNVCFHFEIAGDILREETFLLLEKMPKGVVQLEIGMQSFHEPTLKAVRRVTNTEKLIRNIHRLVAMRNMHIHIDLIAGLPLEDLPTFKKSFDIGYSLHADMLQLGFLKVLYGSQMRVEAENFPCEFTDVPPYQVTKTPWLSKADLEVLSLVEDAVERTYNSGRFIHTLEYVTNECGLTPFDLYHHIGKWTAVQAGHPAYPLDIYIEKLQFALQKLPGVNSVILRDMLVMDRLETNQTGRLPTCLQVQDKMRAKAYKALEANANTKQQKNLRRGMAILYSRESCVYVDYEKQAQDIITKRWTLHEVFLTNLLKNSEIC